LKALADYGEAIRLKPDYADAYLKRASLLDERGDLIGAANDYSQVIKLSPNLPDPYFQRGYIHYKQEDFSAAINDFSAVLNLDLKNDKAYYYRGIIYIDQNNLTSAIDDLSKAMKINPKDPGYSFQRGIAQAKSKNLDDALSDFTTSITLNPENPGSYYERGKIFAQKGDFNGATDDFTHVIKIGSSTPLTYYAYINRAFVRAQNGDSEGAVNDATHATEANPQDSEGWNSLCWLGSLTGRAQQVLSACDQAIALDPANGNYQDSRGLARALNGDRKGAIEDFNNFIAWSKANGESEQERNERTEWSKALQKGKNPFNEALLNDLMGRSNIFGVITPTPEALSGVELSTESSPPACKKSNIAWKSPKDNMPLVCVPAGEFSMGSKKDDPLSYPNEHPQHTVYLDAFWIDRTEITNQMYSRCVQASECKPPIKGSYQYNNASYVNHPVIVDWQSAQAYCQWVERRLPSEAEWEKAARGVDTLTYPWGNEITCQDANYAGCVGDSKPVGSYPDSASPYGALDMAGNVWEWVADWYDKGYYSNSPSINPQGPPSGERHILRGGAWDDSYDRNLRTTYRNGLDKDTTGFRCVLGPNFPKTTPP
jgi:formylglycine-generating enzyme required for sulfatase activity/Flp pilus assembly protein TadD